jgi:hypothetical protein
MKTLILTFTACFGLSFAGFAQGTITLDGSENTSTSPNAATSGRVFIYTPNNYPTYFNGLDTSQDINCELLYSTSQYGGFMPAVTLLLSSSNYVGGGSALGQVLSAAGDITFYENGTLIDSSGLSYVIPGIPAGGTAYFELEGWLGNYSSLSAAETGVNGFVPVGVSAVFSETLSSATSPIQASMNNMPALNLVLLDYVPEPSSLLMAGIGIGSMLVIACLKMNIANRSKVR